MGPIIEDPQNVFLVCEGGCIIFARHDPGIYEVHTNFLRAFRGRYAIEASLAAYRWMFTHTDCMSLLTKVPDFNKPAYRFCAIVGATKEFDRNDAWLTENGLIPASFWSLRYDDWVRKTDDLVNSGKRFHARLDEEFARHGATEPHHAQEDCHDRHVGAAAEMIYGGQVAKGIVLYNRFAQFAGYGPISLIASNPLMIDIGDALLQVTPDAQTFRVIKTKQPVGN